MNFLESLNVELKEILTSELKKEVVAFANICDGIIYIGVNDKGEVIGVENSDDVIERAGAFQVILPNIHYQSEIEENIEKQPLVLVDEYKKIINFLDQGTKNRKEIQEHIGLSQSKIITMLRELLSLGLIIKIGKGKNTKYQKI